MLQIPMSPCAGVLRGTPECDVNGVGERVGRSGTASGYPVLGCSSYTANPSTSMMAVNAIAPLCEAPPGVRTFLDLPLVRASRAFAL